GYTDSGAAGTALSTGNKTVGGFIGIGLYGDTLTHISQAAKAAGKSKGIVTSVPLSHATPAAFVAHNEARHNYEEIGRYMLFHSRLDVLMGAGHPGYNDDGVTEEISARYPGGDEIWEQLASNEGRTAFSNDDQQLYVQDVDGDGQRDPWTLIESREDFLDMASGPAPKRVIGIPQVYSTLNYGRSMEEEKEMPFTQPFNENVPTLEEMTRASINILSQEDEGFFLMVEGGAIDWAGHDNHLGRMIEEMTDFNHSIEAAVEWVEENSSWEETLIIVTSDHETGYLTGPNHPEPVNDPVVNRGQGNLPEVQWNSGGHTNMLVPFYAKGPGTEMFTYFADEKDPVRGPFLQNTDIPNAIFLMWGRPDIELHRLNE
ncbi:MAG: alkaline phosphatase, partial [Bacteroidales bacterium]